MTSSLLCDVCEIERATDSITLPKSNLRILCCDACWESEVQYTHLRETEELGL